MLAVQNNGKYRFYDVKNLYGLTEANATQQALFAATGKRGTVISRFVDDVVFASFRRLLYVVTLHL